MIRRRRPLTSQRRRTDVTERRRTSQGRHLEFTVLRRHDVGIRRHWDQFMTTCRRRHDVEGTGAGMSEGGEEWG